MTHTHTHTHTFRLMEGDGDLDAASVPSAFALWRQLDAAGEAGCVVPMWKPSEGGEKGKGKFIKANRGKKEGLGGSSLRFPARRDGVCM